MSSPLVSVIIPCYRQAHYLSGAIESVLNQDCPSVEIVVVNDGSDDNTDEVAARFADRTHYVKKLNGGLPSARNAGISVATGRYLLFLDSDDLLDFSALGRLVEAMGGREDRVAVMGFRMFETDPRCEPAMRNWTPTPEMTTLTRLVVCNHGPPHCYLVPRAAVNAVGRFDESLTSCEDWDLWIRVGLAGASFVAVPYIGAFYRQYPGQMSRHAARMELMDAEVRWRTALLLETNTQAQTSWGVDWPATAGRLRERAKAEFLDAAYRYRLRSEFRAAFSAYWLALRRGGCSLINFTGPLKLVPISVFHWVRWLTSRVFSAK